MEKTGMFSLLYPLFMLSVLVLNCHSQEKKLHIIYMGGLPDQQDALVATKHHSMLHTILGSTSLAEDSLVYSYERSFNGFAAKLTTEEAARISEMEGVVSVSPNRIYNLHTTRSWDFIHHTSNLTRTHGESNVIIGVIDTGAWPEHPSFDDTGFGPPPSRWKGTCKDKNFTCNNKLIGARHYNIDGVYVLSDLPTPRDTEGHGTHTSSTAAGSEVPNGSYFGLGKGTTRGGAPNARIAVYKVCWTFGCGSADILKAFDDAIADGVDIISLSLGSGYPVDYLNDTIAIGAFHAMSHGILTSASAGNSGPDPATVSNFAPWALTVAASTIDRKFVTRLQLGNGQFFTGTAINAFDLGAGPYPLVWGGDAANYTAGSNSGRGRKCEAGALSSDRVSGKIVFCEAVKDGSGVFSAKGAGIIMADVFGAKQDAAYSWPLSATSISALDGLRVLDYIKSTANPTATILRSEEWKDGMAPTVVSFSSRGPNPISPDILKPDLTAPGVDILAGWSPLASSTLYNFDTRASLFNIISGTSMACPHVSGAAAYVKAAHPTWSPAAVKSALMTTATVVDPRRHEDLEFSYGSGQISPGAARHPGLVFDASEADYIDFLCKQGYNAETLALVAGHKSSCKGTLPGRGWDLNYPSFALYVGDGEKINGTFTRKVTNVGAAKSTYEASVYVSSESISVNVRPAKIKFSAIGQTRRFTVTVTGPEISQQPIVSGAITWRDGVHTVRAPLAVYNYIPGAPYV